MLRGHPGIVDAAVVARRDEHLGQVPVAVIVTREGGADLDDEAILRACRDRWRRSRSRQHSSASSALPRTPGGKLRREVVRALVDGGSSGILARPGGDEIGWRVTGSGPTPVVLLPGTLSSAAQLDRLATELAAPGDVHGPRRRPPRYGNVAPRGPAPARRRRPRARPRRVPRRTGDRARDGDRHQLRRGRRARARSPTARSRPRPGRVGAAVRAARRSADPRAIRDARSGHGRRPSDRRSVGGGRDVPAFGRRGRRLGPAPRAGPGIPRPRRRRRADVDAALRGLDPDGLRRIAAPTTILTGDASDAVLPADRRRARRARSRVRAAPPSRTSPTLHRLPTPSASPTRSATPSPRSRPHEDQTGPCPASAAACRPVRRRDRRPVTPPRRPRSGRCSTASPASTTR